MEFYNQWVAPNWPFFAAMIIFASIGQVTKGIVTKKLATKKRWAWLFRKTMPLHPIIAGLAVGYSNVLPASMGADTAGAKALYFGLAGVASSYFYAVAKHFLSKKGIELKSPDELDSDTPSEPPGSIIVEVNDEETADPEPDSRPEPDEPKVDDSETDS